MPIVDDEFDQLERRVEQVFDNENLSECLELDFSCNDEWNETFAKRGDNSDKKTENEEQMRLKAQRKQTHKIRKNMIETAIKAVEIQLRTKHGIVPGTELNEHTLRMSAQEMCTKYNINAVDTYLLSHAPVYRAMIPDQRQMDAIRIIYNSETQGRVASVEALRNNAKFSHYTPGPYA